MDGSAGADYAAQYVAGIAKRLGVAEVRILNVQPEPGRGRGAQTMASPDEAAEQATANSRRMLRAAGLTVTLEVAIGPDPARLIANAARKSRVDEIVIDPEDNSIVSCSADGSLSIWDMTSYNLKRVLDYRAGRAQALAKAGRRLVSGHSNGDVHTWDADSGRELHRFEGHSGAVRGLAVSRDGRRALTGGDDRTARLWQLPN